MQILINRESLRHLDFDIELLGDCDVICNELLVRLGEDWTTHCKRKDIIEVLPLKPLLRKGLEQEEEEEKNEKEGNEKRMEEEKCPGAKEKLETDLTGETDTVMEEKTDEVEGNKSKADSGKALVYVERQADFS